ncbi:MAG: copper amine oxidase N-terminal domain-containing protein, partial [Clostridiaceae bacterium]|nr:copper amine oxidase N-terminal domain-containing protein [Clostridiaceae bacterium]
YVPARYVAEAFGATVRWDSVIKTVYIDTNGSVAPTPQGTKDPITGWIKVDTEGEYSEYLQIITFASDTDILVARYNEAEKMFIEKYGDSDVVKNIFNYVRTKKTRNNSIEKRFYLNNKAVDVLGSDISVQIIVWKEGVQ